MRNSNRFSKWMLAAGLMLAGASALPAADWRDSYRGGQDFRSDYRDNAAIDRLRDRIAADRVRLDEDYRRGRRGAADRDRRVLDRDQRALEALMRNARYDRSDVRRDAYNYTRDYGR